MANRFKIRTTASIALVILIALAGCRTQPPSGTPIQPGVLGAVTDQINQLQEDNAELAKLIIYTHEFEPNVPYKHPKLNESELDGEQLDFNYLPPERVRGFRLTPKGQDHVRQIAFILNRFADSRQNNDPLPFVMIEQNETSKRWNTEHRFPVQYNQELDEYRRRFVVQALTAFGVPDADKLVVVGPAYPEGLSADEAANAYGNLFQNIGPANNGSNSNY